MSLSVPKAHALCSPCASPRGVPCHRHRPLLSLARTGSEWCVPKRGIGAHRGQCRASVQRGWVAARAEAEPRQPLGVKVGFIGGGNMATAMIGGFIAAGTCLPEDVVVCVRDVSSPKSKALRSLGVTLVAASGGGAQQVARACDVIFLSVKPVVMSKVVDELAPHVQPHHVIATVAAGIEIAAYEAALPQKTRFLRVMPNTPCAVQAGVCSITRGTHATAGDVATLSALLSAMGLVCEVEERQIHAVVGVAGSAPAYLFLIIEAMADGGVRAGLPRDVALRMAAQSVMGAGKLVLQTGEHPGELKDKVCSPGGTTIEAVAALEDAGVRRAMLAAVSAAVARSKQLAG